LRTASRRLEIKLRRLIADRKPPPREIKSKVDVISAEKGDGELQVAGQR